MSKKNEKNIGINNNENAKELNLKKTDMGLEDKSNPNKKYSKNNELLFLNIKDNSSNSSIGRKNSINSAKSFGHPMLNLFNTKTKKFNNYTDNELNSLTYDEALIIDSRTYLEYYISLLKTKQMLLFTFCNQNDFNSINLKISLFLFSFALYYTISSLFFQDSTIHKIYEDNGKFNFEYQIPKIIYSSLISIVITIIIKYFSLSENNVINGKKNKDNPEKIIKVLKIKFLLFFILTFFFLIIFWYYLSCFCAVYKNTQIHLLKDTLISFGLSMTYSFGINLAPGILRIPALRNKNNINKILYNISKIIQII